ncbi:MAG TPA: hypothetical protein VFS31_14000, partial [Chitinophagaceae bacterium]|nr:hypothetical protein [Chitinophagaceae bacterium]
FRVCHVISTATEIVGNIIIMPNGFQSMAQLISFANQKRICRFSIFRNFSGITYILKDDIQEQFFELNIYCHGKSIAPAI